MKYAIVIPDGAADDPIPALDDRTPLEAANTPAFDWVAANGRQGTVVTVPERFAPGSDVATLSVLGYDPRTCYSGRAPLEAVARDVPTNARDMIFRCNLVTIAGGQMLDFTAGHISQAEAGRIIKDLNACFVDDPVEFYVGVQYRHLMVLRDTPEATCDCIPPHDILDQPVNGHAPRGPGADRVVEIMDRAAELLADHEVNVVRRDLEENPATNIWLWGQGRVRPLQLLTEQFNLRAASIAGVDLARGITKLIGFDQIAVEGATGYLDTNYAGKGSAAVEALDRYDLVLVHVEAPDEAGHLGDAEEKVRAIECVDTYVAGPLLEKLRTLDAWKMLIVPDHPTPVRLRTHTATPPPFCLAGTGVLPVLRKPFTESNAADSDLHISPGHELMEFFLRG
jgi:2,3-bisphosphoglycerate-independent phosphoglycerate mutase